MTRVGSQRHSPKKTDIWNLKGETKTTGNKGDKNQQFAIIFLERVNVTNPWITKQLIF
jgi:hypothetical protein